MGGPPSSVIFRLSAKTCASSKRSVEAGVTSANGLDGGGGGDKSASCAAAAVGPMTNDDGVGDDDDVKDDDDDEDNATGVVM